MKIKNKKTFNLPQLIEWAWDNTDLSHGMTFISNGCERVKIGFRYNPRGVLNLDILNGVNISNDIQFTLEEFEEITEDTVIPKMLEMSFDAYQNVVLDIQVNQSINTVKENAEVLTLHVINDDGTHTLIWRDGKLVDQTNEENLEIADACIDQLSDIDKSNFDEQQTKAYNTAYQALYTLASELEE